MATRTPTKRPAKKAPAKKAPAKKGPAKTTPKTPVKQDYDSLKKGVEKLLDKYGTTWCKDGKGAVATVLKPLGVESKVLESKWSVQTTFNLISLEEKDVTVDRSTYSYNYGNRVPSAAFKNKLIAELKKINIDGVTIDDIVFTRWIET